MLKEERVNKLMEILPNYKEIEILNKLREIEDEVGIENILPFYDELIEIVLMGINIEVEEIEKYYKVYSNSYIYHEIKLNYVARCLKSNIKEVIC